MAVVVLVRPVMRGGGGLKQVLHVDLHQECSLRMYIFVWCVYVCVCSFVGWERGAQPYLGLRE